ncbi:unnamed protein product [Brassica oleracea]
MPKQECEGLREEEDIALIKLQRQWVSFALSSSLHDLHLENCVSFECSEEAVLRRRAFYLTDQETVDFYWMVVFLPSMMIFLVSSVYLVAGELLYLFGSSPLLKITIVLQEEAIDLLDPVSGKFTGGVRCLSILNVVFAIIYGLLAIFLGSSLLALGSSCSVPLFWCYEVSSWGLVVLYAGTASFLRRRAALSNDEGEFGNRNHQGLEMLEANPLEFTPDVERRVNQGFKAWMETELTTLLPWTDQEMIVDPEDKSEQVASRSVEVVDIHTDTVHHQNWVWFCILVSPPSVLIVYIGFGILKLECRPNYTF